MARRSEVRDRFRAWMDTHGKRPPPEDLEPWEQVLRKLEYFPEAVRTKRSTGFLAWSTEAEDLLEDLCGEDLRRLDDLTAWLQLRGIVERLTRALHLIDHDSSVPVAAPTVQQAVDAARALTPYIKSGVDPLEVNFWFPDPDPAQPRRIVMREKPSRTRMTEERTDDL